MSASVVTTTSARGKRRVVHAVQNKDRREASVGVRMDRVCALLSGVLESVQDSQLRGVADKLEQAAAEVRRLVRIRWQRLPSWCVPGALVEWIGEGRHDVYVVTSVHERSGSTVHAWRVELARSLEAGNRYTASVSPERGRRYWRKYRGPLTAVDVLTGWTGGKR